MATDEVADTDSELSIEPSEYCSEPDSDDDRIPPVTVINTDEDESTGSLSREEFDFMDNNQSIVSGILGPTEKVACSTLIETPDKTEPNPSFQIPASVPTESTQPQIIQKDKSAEIIKKLDQIIENQVVMLSLLEIRTQPDAVENPTGTVNEIVTRQSPPPPLPQLIPMQINNPLNEDVRSATNINPVVSDAMLAETLRLKPKSSSAGNLAFKHLKNTVLT